MVTADDVHRGRPDPECDLYCAQRIGVRCPTHRGPPRRPARLLPSAGGASASSSPRPAPFAGRPPARCVVIGNSNGAVEAAREVRCTSPPLQAATHQPPICSRRLPTHWPPVPGRNPIFLPSAQGGMKVVCVASRHAAFELSAADLVVRSVKDLSVMNLKSLFAREDEEERMREQARAASGRPQTTESCSARGGGASVEADSTKAAIEPSLAAPPASLADAQGARARRCRNRA